ncbi:GNAT family N-acetyltransferase [Mucilaginibacter sp. BT774]|uniref:GNAT family N-acetyltransferase n=1 Tax=Mucilaginibacter sp. BT774 TaxID=3062276 RepID=UPI002676A1B5|nr:GNAT family N-acetyltransferase [Mucilaginibacter sp. BT774]MDO3627895.1 GNAT family N-acetyltransferase [Mucilaginibacter sp. BT774]
MIFPPFTNLITDRLILRELQAGDAEQIFRIRTDSRVNAFLDRGPTKSVNDSLKFINNILKAQNNKDSIMWVITLKNDPKLIGTVLYWHIVKEQDKAELGYEMLPEYFGQGIMREALTEVIRFGFETMELKNIVAEARVDNLRSINALQKCGFQQTGVANDRYLIYELRSPFLSFCDSEG